MESFKNMIEKEKQKSEVRVIIHNFKSIASKLQKNDISDINTYSCDNGINHLWSFVKIGHQFKDYNNFSNIMKTKLSPLLYAKDYILKDIRKTDQGYCLYLSVVTNYGSTFSYKIFYVRDPVHWTVEKIESQ